MKFGPERFVQNVIPDLRDNIPSNTPAPIVHEKLSDPMEAQNVVERLISPNVQKEFRDTFSVLEPGEYRARVAVGKAEDGTRHPHDYFVVKGADGMEFYFVDPEHQMGKSKNHATIPLPRKGDIRPKISTLIAMKMVEAQIPSISMLRYRAVAIEDPSLLKMAPQYEMAKGLLADSDIPELLKGKEQEITFRLDIRPDDLLVQSRYASQKDLARFLKGESTAAALDGKAYSYRIIMNQFLKHFKEGRFEMRNPSSQAFKKAA